MLPARRSKKNFNQMGWPNELFQRRAVNRVCEGKTRPISKSDGDLAKARIYQKLFLNYIPYLFDRSDPGRPRISPQSTSSQEELEMAGKNRASRETSNWACPATACERRGRGPGVGGARETKVPFLNIPGKSTWFKIGKK